MDKLDVSLFQKMFIQAADCIIKKESYLTEIDSAIGDGDHGITMKRGWSRVKELLLNHEYQYVDDLCYAVSMQLLKTMGGASGVIFATMFFGGLSELGHSKYATVKEISKYFSRGEKSIENRGKAKPGDKTMLDALSSACIAMECQAESTADIKAFFEAAYNGAKQGAEQTKCMRSNQGRSKNFGDKTLGLPDPGAVSTSYIFYEFYQTLVER